jgi:hypothetical protein
MVANMSDRSVSLTPCGTGSWMLNTGGSCRMKVWAYSHEVVLNRLTETPLFQPADPSLRGRCDHLLLPDGIDDQFP